jgi:hypothetical protein
MFRAAERKRSEAGFLSGLKKRAKAPRIADAVEGPSKAEKTLPTHKTPLHAEGRFEFLRWPLASQNLWAMVVSIAPTAGFPGRFPFFLKGRFVGGGSCRVSAVLLGCLASRVSRYITGTLLIAI